MDDARSKVTLRPRSKLERLLDGLEDSYGVPPRPDLDLVSQLALLHLVAGGADPRAAAAALKPLCGATSSVDPEKLAQAPREVVASVCDEAQVDDVRKALQALGELATLSPGGLDARCREDLAESRRVLRQILGIGEQRADLLLLQSGIHALVAPSGAAVQVVARIGYPGTNYASFARALDEELPDQYAVAVAWRAHHLLDQHGRTTCLAKSPECKRCPIREACAYRGEGDDPASRLSWRAPPADGGPSA